ncbi:hypothetical protein C2G38_2110141, partial [Gigaspora rosea]
MISVQANIKLRKLDFLVCITWILKFGRDRQNFFLIYHKYYSQSDFILNTLFI